jgi:hypothetical protein
MDGIGMGKYANLALTPIVLVLNTEHVINVSTDTQKLPILLKEDLELELLIVVKDVKICTTIITLT